MMTFLSNYHGYLEDMALCRLNDDYGGAEGPDKGLSSQIISIPGRRIASVSIYALVIPFVRDVLGPSAKSSNEGVITVEANP